MATALILMFLFLAPPCRAAEEIQAVRVEEAGRWRWATFELPDSMFGGEPTEDGSVWFGAKRGAVRHRSGAWTLYDARDGMLDAPVYAMCRTKDDALWFFAGERFQFRGLSRYHRGAWTRTTAEELALDDAFPQVLLTKSGDVWVVGSEDGRSAARRYDGRAWEKYGAEDGLVGTALSSPLEASNGDFRFGTTPWFQGSGSTGREGDGILRFDGRTWASYTAGHGLADDRVHTVVPLPTPSEEACQNLRV